jgi:hypothetical protein
MMGRVMKRIIWLILLFVTTSGFFPPCWAGSAVDMREGLWEIATEIEMAGVPVKMPGITTRQCISPENVFPEISRFNASDQNCKVTNVVIGKNYAAYDLTCTLENGEMKGHGSVTYRGERLKGSLNTTTMPENIQMNYLYEGWYIGPCR